MINANDLRIGNFITQKGYNFVEIVTTDLLQRFECKEIYLEPIPITEKWLTDFGFETWSDNTDDIMFFFYENTTNISINFTLDKSENKHYLSYQGETINCLYVHDLQNLFYFLSGKKELILINK